MSFARVGIEECLCFICVVEDDLNAQMNMAIGVPSFKAVAFEDGCSSPTSHERAGRVGADN